MIALVTAALALGGCGGDTGGMGLAAAERYCELVKQVVDAGRQELQLELDAGTPDPEAVKAEFSDFLADHGHELDELQRAAPSEVAGDVETFVEEVRTTAETGDLSDSDRYAQAWRRMAEYERLECDTGE